MNFDFSINPIESVIQQIEFAKKNSVVEPTAMSLSTVDINGFPSSRTVLFKGLMDQSLLFFTNYNSPKGQDLDVNPRASLLFYWSSLAQQIKLKGLVKKTSRPDSEKYFKTRPRLSQVGAWASQQSQKIDSYDSLMEKVKSFDVKFEGEDVPCPDYWGGYAFTPFYIEFWFGKEGRLHERYCYEKKLDQEGLVSSVTNLDISSAISSLQSQSWNHYLKSP